MIEKKTWNLHLKLKQSNRLISVSIIYFRTSIYNFLCYSLEFKHAIFKHKKDINLQSPMCSLESPPFSRVPNQSWLILRLMLTTRINIYKPTKCQVPGPGFKIGYIVFFLTGLLTFLATKTIWEGHRFKEEFVFLSWRLYRTYGVAKTSRRDSYFLWLQDNWQWESVYTSLSRSHAGTRSWNRPHSNFSS